MKTIVARCCPRPCLSRGKGGIGGLLARTDGNGSTFYHADGQTAGIFLASVGFGVGPINIIGISGNVGSAPEKLVSGDIDVDIGPSTDFSAGDLLEKPKPGFAGGGGFIGLRIKKVD